jgi:hypothetical protein
MPHPKEHPHVPRDWTPEQALAVACYLGEFADQIWHVYETMLAVYDTDIYLPPSAAQLELDLEPRCDLLDIDADIPF